MKPGDLVKWTFAKTSGTYNRENKSYMGVLLYEEKLPQGSWIVLLSTGERVHACESEIEIIKECK